MNPYFNDLFHFVDSSFGAISTATAAGTGDATAVTGATVDLLSYDSLKIVIPYTATLTDEKSLLLAVEYQQSADGTNWDTATAIRASSIIATSDGGTTETGVYEYDMDASGLKRYFRVNYTPDLNASGTDTAKLASIVLKGGRK